MLIFIPSVFTSFHQKHLQASPFPANQAQSKYIFHLRISKGEKRSVIIYSQVLSIEKKKKKFRKTFIFDDIRQIAFLTSKQKKKKNKHKIIPQPQVSYAKL